MTLLQRVGSFFAVLQFVVWVDEKRCISIEVVQMKKFEIRVVIQSSISRGQAEMKMPYNGSRGLWLQDLDSGGSARLLLAGCLLLAVRYVPKVPYDEQHRSELKYRIDDYC